MSSITQIIVTCAFSVLACVFRCTVQTHKEKAVNFFFFCFKFVVLCHQEGRYWVFGLFLLRPINASVTERGIVGMLEKQQQQKELH